MKRTIGRPNPRFKGALLAGLFAAALLVLLGGCGQFNDNPAGTSLTATVNFAGVNQPLATSTSSCAADTLCSPTVPDGGPVNAILIGPIVIGAGHNNGSGVDGAWTANDVNNITDTDKQNLIDDAEQSAQYVALVTLPNSSTVQFVIPPDGAGNWQLVAAGINVDMAGKAVADVKAENLTWFGFIDHFLNNEIQPGGTLTETLTMQPYCAPNGPISQANGNTNTTCP